MSNTNYYTQILDKCYDMRRWTERFVQVNISSNGVRVKIDTSVVKAHVEDALALYIQRIVISARCRGKRVYTDVGDLFEDSRNGIISPYIEQ